MNRTRQILPVLRRHLVPIHIARHSSHPSHTAFRAFASMSNPNEPRIDATTNFPKANSNTPGEEFEVRQTSSSEDYKPDPSKSIPLDANRQALIVSIRV